MDFTHISFLTGLGCGLCVGLSFYTLHKLFKKKEHDTSTVSIKYPKFIRLFHEQNPQHWCFFLHWLPYSFRYHVIDPRVPSGVSYFNLWYLWTLLYLFNSFYTFLGTWCSKFCHGVGCKDRPFNGKRKNSCSVRSCSSRRYC